MKSHHHIDDLLRIRGGLKYASLVLLERSQPIANVRGMLRDVGRDAQLAGKKGARKFRRNSSIA
jgi:hypothetical protein